MCIRDRITATRNNVPTVSESAKMIAYGDPNLQDLITGVENVDGVAAFINIETPTGTLTFKKSSEDGVVAGIKFTTTGTNFEKIVTTGLSLIHIFRCLYARRNPLL